MNVRERERILNEATMQTNALKRINRWKNDAFAISTLGVAIVYANVAGANRNLFFGILGGLLMCGSFVAALILNLGLKNGRANVDKMLKILGEGK